MCLPNPPRPPRWPVWCGAVNDRLVGRDDGVLVMITGSGLKDTRAAIRAGGQPLRIAPDLDVLAKSLHLET